MSSRDLPIIVFITMVLTYTFYHEYCKDVKNMATETNACNVVLWGYMYVRSDIHVHCNMDINLQPSRTFPENNIFKFKDFTRIPMY